MDIIPKFREIDLYAMSLSLLLALIISPELAGAYFHEFSSSYKAPAVLGLLALISLYAVPRSIHLAWTPSVPGKIETGVLVLFALGIMGISAFASLSIWLYSYRDGIGTFDVLTGILVILGVLRIMGIMLLMRYNVESIGDHFDRRDSSRSLVIYATILVFAVAFVGRVLSNQPGVVLFLAMVETSRFAEYMPKAELKLRKLLHR